ncbi:MAG TPA: hypothetical protein PKD00_00770 [Burkholderiales bacterium]|nr:hypothetical protein [Burkholderiales bacterium]
MITDIFGTEIVPGSMLQVFRNYGAIFVVTHKTPSSVVGYYFNEHELIFKPYKSYSRVTSGVVSGVIIDKTLPQEILKKKEEFLIKLGEENTIKKELSKLEKKLNKKGGKVVLEGIKYRYLGITFRKNLDKEITVLLRTEGNRPDKEITVEKFKQLVNEA